MCMAVLKFNDIYDIAFLLFFPCPISFLFFLFSFSFLFLIFHSLFYYSLSISFHSILFILFFLYSISFYFLSYFYFLRGIIIFILFSFRSLRRNMVRNQHVDHWGYIKTCLKFSAPISGWPVIT